jgi:hypothetical protein
MNADSKLSRLILVSPSSLLIFLIIPLLVILSVKFHIGLPLAGFTKLLLVNNICFAFLIACRLLRYLFGMGKAIRYDAGHRLPASAVPLPLSLADARKILSSAGYAFTGVGTYGE